ncbi:MAG: hypothetical protein ACR2G6_06035 [Gemmatimonadaceae bacterium]
MTPATVAPQGRASALAQAACIAAVIAGLSMPIIVNSWNAAIDRVKEGRKAAIEHVVRANSALAFAYAENAAGVLTAAHGLLLTIAQHPFPPGNRSGALEQLEDRTAASSLPLLAVAILDDDGLVALSTGDRGCAQTAARTKSAPGERGIGLGIGTPSRCEPSGKWMIPLTLRIAAANGEPASVAVAALDAGYFTEMYRQAELGAGGIVALVGLDGVARVRQTSGASSYGDDMRESPPVSAQTRSPSGFARGSTGSEAVDRYYSYRTLQRYPLMVAVGTAEAEALAPVRERKRSDILIAGLASIVIGLVAAGIARGVAQWRRGSRRGDLSL